MKNMIGIVYVDFESQVLKPGLKKNPKPTNHKPYEKNCVSIEGHS